VVTALLAAACSGHTPTGPQQESLGVPFQLYNGQSVVLPSEPLRVTFQGVISDSRCPPGWECIVEGEINAGFDLSVAGGAPVSFHLATMTQKQQTISGYVIQLLDASSSDPPPNGGTYRVQLVVTK